MTTNSFSRHGIKHLSASSLNLWAAQPALWIMERLLGRRMLPGIAAARGKAVEHGVHLGLSNPQFSIEECIESAEREFTRQTALSTDPRREEERKKLAGWVRGALAELHQYGTPDGYQEKIEIQLDDVVVPLIGFIDWRFAAHGLIVDLKTTERFPSQIGNAHGRQGAVYASAHSNFGMRFAYAKPAPGKTDKRQVTVYEMSGDDIQCHLAALRAIALSLGRFLAVSKDARELAGLIVPDFDSFWWSEPAARAAGRQVFGFSKAQSQRKRRSTMGLNIGGSSIIKPYVKYNAKADKWFVRSPEGGDQEIARPTFLLDLKNIRTGWLRFREGQAPERVIDPSLDRAAPNPGEDFKRGFVVMAFSPKFFGGAVEFSSASIHLSNVIRELYAVYEDQNGKTENRGKVPVIACTGSEPMKDKYGTNYRPKLEIVKWVDRPADLADESPVDDADVWKGPSPAATKPAQHVAPPPTAKPVAEPLSEPLF